VTTQAVLLDTNVLSELVKPQPDARVSAFVAAQTDPFVSVITLHELTWGAERAPNRARRAKLLAWIASVRAHFAGRLVDVDAETAEHGGRLRAAAAAQGCVVDAIDSLIAASALSRGAVVATRNVKDFEPLGVTVIDPWNS
jgi:predicted nucleic acid-binding protein